MHSSTEEFIVDVQTDANEWDPRILVVSSRYIDEGDTTSGTSVVRHETKHLTNVQETVKGKLLLFYYFWFNNSDLTC